MTYKYLINTKFCLLSYFQILISIFYWFLRGYMAPEYIAKGRLTEKFDVYSFGILVIEIVTGIENNKHQSEDAYETLIAHVTPATLPNV